MAAIDLGPWDPMPVSLAADLFEVAAFRWWVSGGHALDLHLRMSWRSHQDTDVGVLRGDVPQLARVLDGWDIRVAAEGALTPWDRGALSRERSQNNLWCRPTPDAPWRLDLTISEGDDQFWIYRRDSSIRRRWTDAVLRTDTGLPYLAPELQILFKSEHVRQKDDLDAMTVIPLLEPSRKRLLASLLASDHPWQEIIAN